MSMKLSGKKLTTAILAGLMGATMFGGSVFAEVSDQEFIEVRQGVNSNKARISQLENAQSTAKDYSTDIAANKKAIGDEAAARESGDNALYNQINKESANQNVTSESDLIKKDQSVGQNLTNVDTALHKEIAARIGADKAQDKVIQTVNSNLANSVDTINRNVAEGFAALNATDQTIAGNVDLISNNQNVTSESDLIKKDQSVGQNLTNVDTALHKESAARQADISRLDNKIHDVSKEVDTVGALSMAMSGLHPLSYDEGDARFQLSAAVGTYDGTEALALGGFYHFNRDSMLSVGVATDLGADEHRMGANVGYTRRIGQGGHVSRPSEGTVSDIMKDIKNLEQKQAKMEQENEQLKQQLAALKK